MGANKWLIVLCAACATLCARTTSAQTPTVSGEFTVEPATLLSLGFDWRIAGDDNRNARVDVTFRKKGEQAWRTGLPLLRLQREVINGVVPGPNPTPNLARSPFDYVVPNMFSGGLLNLQPDTEYECRFVLADPDGVTGETTKTVTVRTRSEPQPAIGGKIYHVYPVGYEGQRQEPSFTGLMSAYYMGTAHYDYQNAFPPRVQPGDVILVHAGLYVSDRFHYMNGAARPGYLALGTVFDGTYYLTQSGTAERPIVIKGAGDGEAVFDGDGAQNLFNVMAANYNYFEGLTIRNTNVAFLAGIKNIAGSSGFTLKRSRLYNVGRAVHTDWSGSKSYYIADNVFIGRHDPDRMMGWIPPGRPARSFFSDRTMLPSSSGEPGRWAGTLFARGIPRQPTAVFMSPPGQEVVMVQKSLEKRVETLEKRVELLEQLPERVRAVELQIVQLRDEFRGEFSAQRAEIRVVDEETRSVLRDEIRAGDEETRRVLREEIRAGDEETRRVLREEIRAGDEETRRALRDEMRELFAENGRQMRILHEDVIARIATIREAS